VHRGADHDGVLCGGHDFWPIRNANVS